MNAAFHEISMAGLLAAYAIMIPVWLILSRNSLGLGRELLVSVLRMSLQLVAIGFILSLLFEVRLWYVVIGVFAGMSLNAAWIVVGRSGAGRSALVPVVFLAIVAGAGSVTVATTLFALNVEPWYEPRFFIPLSGMVLGNSMSACALAVERFYSGLKDQRALVETMVALGATAEEASAPIRRSSLRAGLIPTLSSMSGMGIVFLPGMMTGQILGGVAPLEAIRYQVVIMMAILGAVTISSCLILVLEKRISFDEYHLLRTQVINRH